MYLILNYNEYYKLHSRISRMYTIYWLAARMWCWWTELRFFRVLRVCRIGCPGMIGFSSYSSFSELTQTLRRCTIT